LEEIRALNHIITALGEQAKQVSINAQKARQGASQASNDVVGVRSSIVSLTTGERNLVSKFEDINTKLFQLASLLGHIQSEVQGNAGTSVLPGPGGPAQVDGIPIEDYVRQMRKEMGVFSSRIKIEVVTIGGVTFESYEDTLKWVSQYCHKDDWKYVMDMPTLYSLVNTDGKDHKITRHSWKNKPIKPRRDMPRQNKLDYRCLFNPRFLIFWGLAKRTRQIIRLVR
jgi:hypothetical protein